MAAPSLARELFDQIVASGDPVGLIRGMINSNPPTTEGDHFDCKVSHHDPKQQEKKAGELWSEALGGFANAGGGVLIWGLEAKKKQIGDECIDAVIDEKLIPDPVAFESRLRELQRGAIDPPLGNVEIKAFPLPEDDSKGFVVCFVPEGQYKPYRSELADKQYFLRAGDSTQVMGRSVLASMFYPRAKAVFKVQATVTWFPADRDGTSESPQGGQINVRVVLINEGTATANEAVIAFAANLPGRFDGFGTEMGAELPLLDAGNPFSRSLQMLRPIHRLLPVRAFDIASKCPKKDIDLFRIGMGGPDPTLEMTIYCANQEPQSVKVPIRILEVVRFGPRTFEAKAGDESP